MESTGGKVRGSRLRWLVMSIGVTGDVTETMMNTEQAGRMRRMQCKRWMNSTRGDFKWAAVGKEYGGTLGKFCRKICLRDST